ncbi:MAG: hypothetical protein ACJ8FY_10915 [Gemmataceae bacterium]
MATDLEKLEPAKPLSALPWWLFGVASLLALASCQGWLTAFLFDGERPFLAMLDDRPIVSGCHPLHLYHAYLGASALKQHGTTCCFDPNFQAGYPKTPVFDAGCRPGELFLLVGGATYRPEAYKVGLAACFFAAPLIMVAAGLAVGLRLVTATLAGWLTLLIWWGQPSQASLHAGDLDILLVSLGLTAQFASLTALHQRPSFSAWLGLLGSTALSWLVHPVIVGLATPLVLIYYVSVGARHGLFWHGALFWGLFGGIGVNGFWLVDWLAHWWLRNPLPSSTFVLPHRTFSTIWNSSIWGSCWDRGLVVVLMGLATVGVILLNSRRQRATARLMGLGSAGLLVLSLAGITNESIARIIGHAVFIPSLFLMVIPAAYAIRSLASGIIKWADGRPLKLALVALSGVCAIIPIRTDMAAWCASLAEVTPLQIGLPADRMEIVQAIKSKTTEEARILWEDQKDQVNTSGWTALLPILTGRSFIGGLDPQMGIEHTSLGLADQTLAGRLFADWSDSELGEYCFRYNVGWIVCTSPSITGRLKNWSEAKLSCELADMDCKRYLFSIRRDSKSFVLKGRAEWLRADSDRVALGNVVPAGEEVVLSLHYQSGLRVFPSRIKIERDLDPLDPVPFIRLRVPGPTTCITLTWDKP